MSSYYETQSRGIDSVHENRKYIQWREALPQIEELLKFSLIHAQIFKYLDNRTNYEKICDWVGPLIARYIIDPESYSRPIDPYRMHIPGGVFMYSFALYPDEYQPSGHVNISRI